MTQSENKIDELQKRISEVKEVILKCNAMEKEFYELCDSLGTYSSPKSFNDLLEIARKRLSRLRLELAIARGE